MLKPDPVESEEVMGEEEEGKAGSKEGIEDGKRQGWQEGEGEGDPRVQRLAAEKKRLGGKELRKEEEDKSSER